MQFFKKFRIIRNGWKSTESVSLRKIELSQFDFFKRNTLRLTATSDGFGSVEDGQILEIGESQPRRA